MFRQKIRNVMKVNLYVEICAKYISVAHKIKCISVRREWFRILLNVWKMLIIATVPSTWPNK